MQYRVTGIDGHGALVTLDLDAGNAGDAAVRAGERGCTPVRIRRRAAFARPSAEGRSRFAVVLFSQELLALLESGITLTEALQTLVEKETRSDARRTIDGLLAKLRQGVTLSSALESAGGAFPPLYIAAVRASERTGDLREALTRYVAYQSQIDALRKRLVAASIYPVLLVAVGLLVTLFLLGYVVPRFSQIYADLGENLPWASRLLLECGALVREYGSAVAIALAACIVSVWRVLRSPRPREWIARRLWRIPALGERLRVYQLTRFYRTLGMLLRGGTPAVTALSMVSGLLAPGLRSALSRAIDEVRQGRALSQALDANGLTTPVALRMLRVGERSGRMGEMTERIATFYDDDLARWADWATRLFEPLLMALIGILIGLIVILMYMPIFDLAGSIR